MKKLLTLLLCVVVLPQQSRLQAAPATATLPAKTALSTATIPVPATLSTTDEAGAVLAQIIKVNNYWQSHNTPYVRSFWDHAAYHTGNMEAYRLTGRADWYAYTDKWCRHNDWKGAKSDDRANWKYKTYGEGQDFVLFGDWQICFQTYIDMYNLVPAPYKVARAIEVMSHECSMTDTHFWWWADALYMVMPVMTKLYKTTGEVKYLDKLYQNFSWADSLMFDPEEQLYYRDAKYIYPKAKTTNGKKDFWARGDGWVLAGLAKVLSDMPADYRHRPFFEQRFRQLAQGVSRCQQPEGYWTRSMLDKDHAEGPETSGTAFFCYGLLWGMNHGLLDRQQYEPVIQRAWNYLVQVALQPSGAVGYVQPIGERAIPGQQLSTRNEANFGVGAFLLAACEHLRYEDGSLRGDNVSIDLTVTNESNAYCQQVLAVNAADVFQRLGIHGGRQFVVIDAAGLEVPYQLSYDGKVLLEA
ncbi:MAG: glycoside hydrolase family 88 protein, partial [Bacteroidales bacterium]|nr:glycoside hydrolase family 88 protein [Bacteroidales bacterium]